MFCCFPGAQEPLQASSARFWKQSQTKLSSQSTLPKSFHELLAHAGHSCWQTETPPSSGPGIRRHLTEFYCQAPYLKHCNKTIKHIHRCEHCSPECCYSISSLSNHSNIPLVNVCSGGLSVAALCLHSTFVAMFFCAWNYTLQKLLPATETDQFILWLQIYINVFSAVFNDASPSTVTLKHIKACISGDSSACKRSQWFLLQLEATWCCHDQYSETVCVLH